jgi:hypothetical protein
MQPPTSFDQTIWKHELDQPFHYIKESLSSIYAAKPSAWLTQIVITQPKGEKSEFQVYVGAEAPTYT